MIFGENGIKPNAHSQSIKIYLCQSFIHRCFGKAECFDGLFERVLDKLERMGLAGLREHTVVEHLWTPVDIERQYGSNGGSIYGVVSDRLRNLAFKAPKQSVK